MVILKSCPRCEGDMMREEILGDVELVCLQCGFRTVPAILNQRMSAQPDRVRDAA